MAGLVGDCRMPPRLSRWKPHLATRLEKFRESAFHLARPSGSEFGYQPSKTTTIVSGNLDIGNAALKQSIEQERLSFQPLLSLPLTSLAFGERPSTESLVVVRKIESSRKLLWLP